jgi:hypothetical protein
LALLGVATVSGAGAATPMALQCGNVFDAKAARLVGERTIVAGADGRIQAVLPGKVSAPGATVLGPPGPTEGVINSVDDARQAVRQRYKDGPDVIKITGTGDVLSYAKSGDVPQFTVDEVKAVVATAQDYGYKVAAHAHGKDGIRRAVEGGVTSIEHGTYMDDEIMTLMKKHGTWYVPTWLPSPAIRSTTSRSPAR